MVQERRKTDQEMADLRSLMSFAQKFTLNQIEEYGYYARFVRIQDNAPMVYAMQGNRVICVDEMGKADMTPEVQIRRLSS